MKYYYCERWYIRVYKVSRICENQPFHVDLNSRFPSILYSKSYFEKHELHKNMYNVKMPTFTVSNRAMILISNFLKVIKSLIGT